jgi:hypothetical protein
MSIYLQAAKDKFNSDKSVNYLLSFHDFVCECYVKLAPNSYGTHIEEKLIYDLNLTKISASENRGDFACCGKYFEFKVSFLSNKTETYSITHIRPWQNLDYYLLCFVDCTKNFTPNFYVVDKSVISQLKSGYMNGTPQSNQYNTNIELRATVKYDSDNMFIIKNANLLEDTSLDSLRMFITGMRVGVNKQFYIERVTSIKNALLTLRDQNSPYLEHYISAYGLNTIEDCDEIVLSLSECA